MNPITGEIFRGNEEELLRRGATVPLTNEEAAALETMTPAERVHWLNKREMEQQARQLMTERTRLLDEARKAEVGLLNRAQRRALTKVTR